MIFGEVQEYKNATNFFLFMLFNYHD